MKLHKKNCEFHLNIKFQIQQIINNRNIWSINVKFRIGQ